jgi:adenylylsulfate kinase-like enzyme
LELCESRDPKGLYKKARAGELKGLTGIDDPYEPPESPELVLDSANHTAEQLATQVVEFLRQQGKIGLKAK